ncbi:hypothetical protein CLU79DRAFT_791530 [Phycomyces nitens]|nr:hypothetical protein CLU79DRAFT_791530 [Phycomyces nitens]
MSSTSWESLLTPKEKLAYGQLFNIISVSNPGIITGQEAVKFFATSGVPHQILSEIWEAADKDNLGYLTPETFSIALKLIACAQHGREVSDPIFATPVPLPQFEGIKLNVAASPVLQKKLSVQPSTDTITPAEREKYLSIFQAQNTVGGAMDADTARNILVKSKLPTDILGQIWNLADVRKSGSLNATEFVIAMHYVAKLMDGSLTTLPAQLPPQVYSSASGAQTPVLRSLSTDIYASPIQSFAPSTPIARQMAATMTPPQRARTIDSLGNMAFAPTAQSTHWDVTAQEKAQSDAFFDKLDVRHANVLQGKEAVEFFKNSQLPDADLAHIWDMADTQRSGQLTRDEFAIAMHLIHKRLRGDPLPPTLPSTLVPPSPRVPSFTGAQRQTSLQVPQASAPAPVPAPAPAPIDPFQPQDDQDLLGDFGNDEQLTEETNLVNQLQNQIVSLKQATEDVKQQKSNVEQSLTQILGQKKETLEQTAQLREAQAAEEETLGSLRAVIEKEEPGWISTKQAHDEAQKELDDANSHIDQLKNSLNDGRTESERLRRQVHAIQEETLKLTNKLDRLRAKATKNVASKEVAVETAHEEPIIHQPQDAPPLFSFEPDSPSSSVATSPDQNKSFDFPSVSQEPEKPSEAVDFDDVFGDLAAAGSKYVDEESSEFEQSEAESSESEDSENEVSHKAEVDPFGTSPVIANASGLPAGTPKNTRIAPPPPPQAKSQQPLEGQGSRAISGQPTKKSRPPPPPPSASAGERKEEDLTAQVPDTKHKVTEQMASLNFSDSFDDAFGTTNKRTSSSFGDDFDDAFMVGDLSDAKIVESKANEHDFDDFEDAFADFDSQKDKKGDSNGSQNKFSFDSSNFKAKEPEEWDSIFGVQPTANEAPKATNDGFEDAFSASPIPKKPLTHKEELMKMGFDEKEAKDALDRYDQDLEKATNFLLDK